uniref:Putative ovule protein n=1 Tax=Solanum chacoense TaxID=4108 RepID=A0A0V0HQC1_SOLCH
MTITTDNSFDALTQEKITQADVNIDNSSNTKQDKGVEKEQPMSAKEWVTMSFGQVLQGEASTSTIPGIVDCGLATSVIFKFDRGHQEDTTLTMKSLGLLIAFSTYWL